jgi:dephospho-CoA kinase
VRIARIEKRSGLERVEIERRMALQMEEEDKCALADYVVDNSGTLSSLAEQAQILWQQFKNNND